MSSKKADFAGLQAIRRAIVSIPADVSNDAVGSHVARSSDIYAPAAHAAALDPATPIVVGSRGTGKSFWSSALGQLDTREATARAYPKLGLSTVDVAFGYTGIGGEGGVSADALNSLLPENPTANDAKAAWWATVLYGVGRASGAGEARLADALMIGRDWERREKALSDYDGELHKRGRSILVIYDALDTVATTWGHRRLLTEALMEVVWAMRAYRSIRLKLFLRPDQIDDDALRFVELPKLRTGAVRLSWERTDLYGLLFARLAMADDVAAAEAFKTLLKSESIQTADSHQILSRQWPLVHDMEEQRRIMGRIAGAYMASGTYGYKKGNTYDWPITHLADAFDEVTPRSFLGLMIAGAKHGSAVDDRALTPDGIRNGLRAASRTRVDQLHQEFPWIKGVLAPLAGLLLPLSEGEVFKAWKQARTVSEVKADAMANNYLPPFAPEGQGSERDLFEALRRIGVLFRRKDDRVDMPDLFRVAAKLLKKGATAPLK